MKKTIATYNKIAKQYSEKHFDPIFWKKEFGIYQKFITGKKVIDIGCGAGRDAVLFTEKNFDYTGIDASVGMIREARKRVRGAKFLVMDFSKLDFPNQTFDGFWASASILHVPKRRVKKVLRNLKKIIKRGGIGFISIKEKRSINEGVIKESKYGGIKRYFAFYTDSEFRKVLRDVGFSVIRSHVLQEGNTNWFCYFVKNDSLPPKR